MSFKVDAYYTTRSFVREYYYVFIMSDKFHDAILM